jgi:dolichol-phosphate mannosyltransferase
MDLLSVLIPAKNEEETIVETIDNLVEKFNNTIDYEILVINDYSDDNTEMVLIDLSAKYHNVIYANNTGVRGVGNAIKFGLEKSKGDIIAICMADGSDAPSDVLVSYKYIIEEKYDCVFGSRFIKDSKVKNYPYIKRILNRVFNNMVKVVSNRKYNDFTNIFKVYKRNVINSIMPIKAQGFSIGLEMSLKSFEKDYRIKIIPISWSQRKAGKSKLKLIKNIRVYFKTLIISLK